MKKSRNKIFTRAWVWVDSNIYNTYDNKHIEVQGENISVKITKGFVIILDDDVEKMYVNADDIVALELGNVEEEREMQLPISTTPMPPAPIHSP